MHSVQNSFIPTQFIPTQFRSTPIGDNLAINPFQPGWGKHYFSPPRSSEPGKEAIAQQVPSSLLLGGQG